MKHLVTFEQCTTALFIGIIDLQNELSKIYNGV